MKGEFMARSAASRKYQLTINNPVEHGFTHDNIKQILNDFCGLKYWCMCDEVGKEKTPHTHVYVVFKNPVMFTTLQMRFYGSHIEPANGSNQENRDYIRKEGKWLDDEKNETNLIETFEESGEMPPDKSSTKKETAQIYEMVKNGASDYEILEKYPNAMIKLDKVERVRQTLQAERHKNEFRKLEVTYIWGETGAGKTRSVMEKYGYENVYRVTNYAHPFDTYKGQDVIIFEEFRSSLPISDMLIYLDGYPTILPCRYADKQACYTKVYIITNIPLDKQYPLIQMDSPETWRAFKRRIHDNCCILSTSEDDIFDRIEELPD
jgi:hypothetical protein